MEKYIIIPSNPTISHLGPLRYYHGNFYQIGVFNSTFQPGKRSLERGTLERSSWKHFRHSRKRSKTTGRVLCGREVRYNRGNA